VAGKYQFRKLPPSLESFGIAVDFLSRFAPFTTSEVGAFTRAVRRQILRGEHVIGWDGKELIAYAGWLPTMEEAARKWLADGGELKPADAGADAVALTTVATTKDDAVLGLMREARELNPGLRVFFKRNYGEGERPARKAAVLNRTTGAPARAAAKPVPSPARPPIAGDPAGFLFALAERAPGRTERVAVGAESVLIVQDPKVAADVLVGNGSNYLKNFASFTPLFGRSRLTLDGEAWRHSQRISQPHIAPHDVGRAEAVLSRQYAALTEALLGEAGGGPVDAMIDRAAIGSLLGLAFSTEIEDLGGAALQADLRAVIRFCARRAWDLDGVPPIADEAETDAARISVARIRDAIGGMVEARRRASERRNDALDALLAADGNTGAVAGEIDLVGEIVTLIVAGSDTTAAAIGWALSILAGVPDFQETLRGEIREATGGRPASLADAGKVPSLRPFLDETLRMFPPVAILSRFAAARDEIDGQAVEPDDRVLVSVIGLHQNPAAWEAPREFRLERHMGEARPDRRSVFMPFSGGPRICGGARFAQMEMSLAVMLTLQRCRLDLPEPLHLAFEWGASLRRRGGQKVRARPL
jgi:cytochrome P450